MGAKPSQQTIVNEVQNMVANIIVNISVSCNSGVNVDQIVDIKCDPTLLVPQGGDPPVAEVSEGCLRCYQNVVDDRNRYYDLVRAKWDSKAPGVDLPIDLDYQQIINAFATCGRGPCKSCYVADINQNSIVKSVLSCQGVNNIQNQITQQLIVGVTQNLSNNQDMLSGLADILGGGSTESIIMNITNRISSLLTENVINSIKQQVEVQQTVSINDGVVTGLTQNSVVHSITNFFEQTGIFNSILTVDQWKFLDSAVNDQNTIGDLGGLGVGVITTFSKMIKSIMGKVLYFVIIMVCILFGMILLYLAGTWGRKLQADYEEKKLRADLATQGDLSLEEY